MEYLKETTLTIAKVLNVKPETIEPANCRLVEDLLSDSLDYVEVVMAIEKKFKIKLDESLLTRELTLEQLASYIKEASNEI